jgi:inner membrane protein
MAPYFGTNINGELMDLFTHIAIPYLMGRSLDRRSEETAALVLGGVALDLDFLLMPVNWISPSFFLLVHRGITHSLFFGLFTALLVLSLASYGPVSSRIRDRSGIDLQLSRRTALFASAGVIIHLTLDLLTTRGVPLLYPLDPARWSCEIFFYSEAPLLLASLGILILSVKRGYAVDPRKALLILFLLLVLTGGVRLSDRDRALEGFGDGAAAFPAPGLFSWTVLVEDGGRVSVYRYSGPSGDPVLLESFSRLEGPLTEGLAEAIDMAEALPQVKTFRWRSYDVIVSASSRDGGWDLTFRDPVMTARMRDAPPPLRRPLSGLAFLDVRVEGGAAEMMGGPL